MAAAARCGAAISAAGPHGACDEHRGSECGGRRVSASAGLWRTCAERRPVTKSTAQNRLVVTSSAAADKFTSPKTGAVGTERFRENAANGTYWGDPLNQGESVMVVFDTGIEKVAAEAKCGENLLRVAERCGALVPTADFCYEGTCCHCEMEVEGGAHEVGYRASTADEELVRSCICPVPPRGGPLVVRLLSEETAWSEGVL